MTLPKNCSEWLRLFLAGFSTYAACSLALAAIYFARLEDGIGAPAVPPLMFIGFCGFAMVLLSLVALACICVRRTVGVFVSRPSEVR